MWTNIQIFVGKVCTFHNPLDAGLLPVLDKSHPYVLLLPLELCLNELINQKNEHGQKDTAFLIACLAGQVA